MLYRREIDGLRALAVIPVILFHAGFQTFSGGFVGVDVFFVISGYLITTIILAELELGKFSVINFYERRARRILPALFVVIFTSLPFAWLWLPPYDMENFSKSLMAVSTFSSNIMFLHSSGYFDTSAELKPLLHTWSLAVEEQFYLFFPILLMLTWRLGKRWVLILLACIATLSLVAAQLGSISRPDASFYLLPTRGWELLIGAFLAFHFSNKARWEPSKKLNEVLSITGLFMLIYSVFIFNKLVPFPSLYTLMPTVGAALIILCANQQTLVGKILGNKLFVGVGLISYSAYLWHQPLLALCKHRVFGEPSNFILSSLVIAAIVMAYFTWKYIETPFRNKLRFNRAQIFKYSVIGSVLIASFGALGYISHGYRVRLPQNMNTSEIEMAEIDNGWCFYSIDTIKSLSVGDKGLQCWLGGNHSKVKGVLFGDSFAGQYEPLWSKAAFDAKFSINAITTNWCYPSMTDGFTGPKESRSYNQCLINRKYLVENISKYDFAVLGGQWDHVLIQKKMSDVFALVDYIAPKVKLVVIMASPKEFDMRIMDRYLKDQWFGEVFNIKKITTKNDVKAVEANDMLEKLSKKYNNVVFVDRNSIFEVNSKPSDVTTENVPFSLDGMHISIYGSKSAVATFLSSQKYSLIKKMIK